MIFRLHSGDIVAVEDELLQLSTWLCEKLSEVTPRELLKHYLQNTKFKSLSKPFLQVVKDAGVLNNDSDVKLFLECDEKVTNELKEACKQTEPDCTSVLNHVIENRKEIFADLIHHLRFVEDDVFLAVLEYLRIPSEKRSDTMFENLPYLMQGTSRDTDVKAIVDPALHPYMDFVSKLDEATCLKLSKAATLLGIDSLLVLVSCRIARVIMENTEAKSRAKYQVPESNRTAILEKLHELKREKPWNK